MPAAALSSFLYCKSTVASGAGRRVKDPLKKSLGPPSLRCSTAVHHRSGVGAAFLRTPAKHYCPRQYTKLSASAWQPDFLELAGQVSQRFAQPERAAGLLIITVLLYSWATERKKAPLTGRSQLLLPWPRPITSSQERGAQQRIISKKDTTLTQAEASQLQQEGLRLMHYLYQLAYDGAAQLGRRSPDVQQRLRHLPGTVAFQHPIQQLDPAAVFQTRAAHIWQHEVAMTPGILLQHASSRSVAWVMACQLAHGIAMQDAELLSWTIIFTGIASGSLLG